MINHHDQEEQMVQKTDLKVELEQLMMIVQENTNAEMADSNQVDYNYSSATLAYLVYNVLLVDTRKKDTEMTTSTNEEAAMVAFDTDNYFEKNRNFDFAFFGNLEITDVVP